MFKTSDMNWKQGHICCEHWSKGARKDPSDLPDIIVPLSQLKKLEKKLGNAKKTLQKDPASKPKKNQSKYYRGNLLLLKVY